MDLRFILRKKDSDSVQTFSWVRNLTADGHWPFDAKFKNDLCFISHMNFDIRIRLEKNEFIVFLPTRDFAKLKNKFSFMINIISKWIDLPITDNFHVTSPTES